ncbi:uncharacterized protein LOC135500774 [Lineus longissimus]|uniref:uncharacterized protein LOC135500774 n=1 Tax=Lineus longissimus TaxID=88925 RepID=UPI00315CC0FA
MTTWSTRQKRQCLLKVFTLLSVAVSTYMALAVYHSFSTNKQLNTKDIMDFEFMSKDEYTIPDIIHLYWPMEEIPADVVPWIRKWRKTNQDYEVWFWTDDAVRQVLARSNPKFLQTFDHFSQKTQQRSLTLRYFLLYTFGGVFADLDIEPLASLEPVLLSKQCIFAEEHPVHKIAKWQHLKTPVIDSIMACKPKHQFFKFAVDKISTSRKQDYTGTELLTDLLKAYRDSNGTESSTIVYQPYSVFLPSYDKLQPNVNEFFRTCFKYGRKSVAAEWCRRTHDKKFCNCPMKDSVTTHHWQHPFARRNTNTISVRKVMTDAKIMKDVFKVHKTSTTHKKL